MTSMQITNNDNSNSPLQEHNTVIDQYIVETDEDIAAMADALPNVPFQEFVLNGNNVNNQIDEGINDIAPTVTPIINDFSQSSNVDILLEALNNDCFVLASKNIGYQY